MPIESADYLRGRGSQCNTANPYLQHAYVEEHIEGLDEPLLSEEKTQYISTYPKTIINKVESPDIPVLYSMNPYQGCEHGCVYCYARNSHQYWGYSAGLDFERKILVKKNAAALLEKQLSRKGWIPSPIMLSGNTDCYQPVERQLKITRSLLEVLLKFKHPVGLITKNSLILRDLDILTELARYRLVHVMLSINSLREEVRFRMEPRTATAARRLDVVEGLAKAGVPVGIMTAPVIPGLNSMEMPEIIKQAAQRGATTAGYTIVRLNGSIRDVFRDWLYKNFPDAADKVWHQVEACHGGSVSDSRYGNRMRGEGKEAEVIKQLFTVAVNRYMKKHARFEYNLDVFSPPIIQTQLSLF